MAYTWKIAFDGGANVQYSTAEWEVVYNVYGYVQGLAGTAWYDLMQDSIAEGLMIVPGQRHPVITSAFVKSFVPTRVSTSDAWQVAVTYEIRTDVVEPDVSPTSRAARISVEAESVDVPTFFWADGTPILNAAGGLITGVTKPEVHVIFNVEKDVENIPAYFTSLAGKVNEDAVAIGGVAIAAGYLQLRNPRASEQKTTMVNGVPETYQTATFSLVYHPKTWITRILDMGMYQIVLGVHSICLDGEGEPATEPQFLAATGAQLPYPVDPAQVHIIENWALERIAFGPELPLS